MTDATGGTPEAGTGTGAGEPTPETKTDEPKMLSQDEVDKIVAKEKAKARASVEREFQEQAKKEAEQRELERLQGEERVKREWEIKERELTERAKKAEQELAISRAQAMLASKGYGELTEFAANFVGADEKATEDNVAKFDQAVQKLVSAKVSQNLNHGAPPDPNAGGQSKKDDLEAIISKAMGL